MQLEKESDVRTLFDNEKENENQQTNIITNEQSLTSQLHTSENENEDNAKNKRKRKSSDDIFKNEPVSIKFFQLTLLV